LSMGYLLKSRFRQRGLYPRGPVVLAVMPSIPGDTGPRLTVVLCGVSKMTYRWAHMQCCICTPVV
jgi:hypothetical protein